jgi:hypothetical protein
MNACRSQLTAGRVASRTPWRFLRPGLCEPTERQIAALVANPATSSTSEGGSAPVAGAPLGPLDRKMGQMAHGQGNARSGSL